MSEFPKCTLATNLYRKGGTHEISDSKADMQLIKTDFKLQSKDYMYMDLKTCYNKTQCQFYSFINYQQFKSVGNRNIA